MRLAAFAVLALFPPAAAGSAQTPSGPPGDSAYLCETLLPDSAQFLLSMLDPWTGLPYDQIPCECCCGDQVRCPASPVLGPVARAWGVVPQLPNATITPFAQDPSRVAQAVDFSFVDEGPDGRPPNRLFALKLALHLTPGNVFGGIVWDDVERKGSDVRRYRAVWIRYSTSHTNNMWELKLNSGPRGTLPEAVVRLPGTPPGQWADARFDIVTSFPDTVREQLNYLVLAASIQDGVTEPILWIDQISFEADPEQMKSCTDFCPRTLPPYPDLACREPLTGAVNIANALTALSLLPQAGLLDAAQAKAAVSRILDTVALFPGSPLGSQWFQDWHSPVSGMPDARTRRDPPARDVLVRQSSITDQPQLYAALMVVEMTWPDLRARAEAIRQRMDFSVLYDGASEFLGTLHGAFDRCTGLVREWKQEYIGNDGLLGAFLAVASGDVPACFWGALAERGCGPPDAPWYPTGTGRCVNSAIPASEGGGPFLQLAAPLYLSDADVPLGPLSLAQSAGNMLRAQLDFAAGQALPLAGWANSGDPDLCDYMTCEEFVSFKVTPYVSAMALDLVGARAAANLIAFRDAGADGPLFTGTRAHRFGLRDSWNGNTGSARESSYLYLDTGWSALGLLNYCSSGVVRWRFAAHPVAQAGYAALRSRPPVCGPVPSPPLDFFTLTPCRVVDTRGTGAPIGGPVLRGQEMRLLALAGSCQIPVTARAVSLNIAVTGATAAGNVRLFAAGPSAPNISSINYSAGQTRANNAIMSLNASGEIAAFIAQASGTTVHLVIDVNGYFK